MRSRLLILAIILLALILRLVNLGGRSLWYDEAFAVLFAEKGLSAMLYGTLTPVAGGASDIHPLLYYSTLSIWMSFFGQSAAPVRLWSVLLGVATTGLMYGLARELFDDKTALSAAFITAIAPFHVQYSQETRMYALLGLLLLAATGCFIKGWRIEATPLPKVGWEHYRAAVWQRRWWVAFGVLAALAMYTQQLAAFYLVALGLVPFVTRRWDKAQGVMLGTVVAVIVYLPWLVNLPGQFQKVQSYYWIEKPGLGALLRTMFSFLVVNLDIPQEAFLPALVGAAFLAVFLIVQIIVYLRRRGKRERNPLLFVVWLAILPVGLMWLVSQVQPLYLERALLPSALMMYLLLAWMFSRSGLPRPIAVVMGMVGFGLVIVGLSYQYTWATFPNSPFPDALTYIRANWQEGDVVIHQNKLTALPGIYADRSLLQRFIGDLPGSPEDTLALPTQQILGLLADDCVQAAAGGSRRIWWVVFTSAEQQYREAERPEYQQALDWLNAHYTPDSGSRFNDLEVHLFANPRGDLSPECAA